MAIEQLSNPPVPEQKEVVLSWGPLTKKWANDDEFVDSMLKLHKKSNEISLCIGDFNVNARDPLYPSRFLNDSNFINVFFCPFKVYN